MHSHPKFPDIFVGLTVHHIKKGNFGLKPPPIKCEVLRIYPGGRAHVQYRDGTTNDVRMSALQVIRDAV